MRTKEVKLHENYTRKLRKAYTIMNVENVFVHLGAFRSHNVAFSYL